MSGVSRHEARVAIEALRAGVPNRAAIRMLGNVETAIEDRFTGALDAMWSDRPAPGQVVAGGFGTGKSHLLGYLREQALRRNVVVSWVTVSKETPLSQPGLMFAAAMRNAVLPGGQPDDAVTAALAAVQGRQGQAQAMETWASTPGSGIAPVFAAVTHLLARRLPPELMHGIEAFLCGAKPPSAQVRKKLGEMGVRSMFDLAGVKAAELQAQRPRFMAQLLRHAGFAGWCLLVDEVELIGRYGPAQRATAYSELARWLGLLNGGVPGLHVCSAITDDFADQVINGRQDDEKLPERLRNKGLEPQAEMASAAMRAIRAAPVLAPPLEGDLHRHADALRGCYAAAYDWATPAPTMAERRSSLTMRHHVRGWITEWDMLRLQGAHTRIEVSETHTDYSENADVSEPPTDHADNG